MRPKSPARPSRPTRARRLLLPLLVTTLLTGWLALPPSLRRLLEPVASAAPAAGEFQANTTTTSDQELPAVAMDSVGNFVVVWESFGQDPGGSRGVYAQRYDEVGAPQGLEFRVNTFTANSQQRPALAMTRTATSSSCGRASKTPTARRAFTASVSARRVLS